MKMKMEERRKVHSKLTQWTERWTASASALPWEDNAERDLYKANAVDGGGVRV